MNVPVRELQRIGHSVDPWALSSELLSRDRNPVLICDARGRTLYANRAYRRVFGGELKRGANVLRDRTLVPEGVVEQLRRAFDGEVVKVSPYWHSTSNGHAINGGAPSVYVGFQAYPFRGDDGSVVVVIIQYEDRTRLQMSLEQRERLIAERDAVLEQSPQGIVICDSEGGYRLFNRAAERMWGGRREVHSVLDWRVFRAHRPDGSPVFPEDWPLARSLRSGVTVEGEEIQFERFDGGIGTMLNASAPLRGPDGRILGGVAVFTDVTQFRELEKSRDRFISVASHELRTPLTTLFGYAQLLVRRLRRGDGPEQLQPSAVNILRAGRRLDRLVNQLVDVSRLDQGALHLRSEPCDLTTLTRTVIEEISGEPANRQIQLDAPESLPGEWDARRLEQALYLLLENAAQYGHPDRPIRVRLRTWGDVASIGVEYEGGVVDDSTIAHLFDRFASHETPDQRGVGSLGLGLYMTREIILAHKGSVWAERRRGGGLSVTCTLPRER